MDLASWLACCFVCIILFPRIPFQAYVRVPGLFCLEWLGWNECRRACTPAGAPRTARSGTPSCAWRTQWSSPSSQTSTRNYILKKNLKIFLFIFLQNYITIYKTKDFLVEFFLQFKYLFINKQKTSLDFSIYIFI